MDVTRRRILQGMGGLLGSSLWPNLSMATTASQLSMFGQVPSAAKVQRLISAGAPADMLLLALAPERLLGLASFDLGGDYPWLSSKLTALPKLGRLAGRSSTLSLEQLLALNPDLIIDCGTVNDTFRSTAERTVAQTGIPYLLVSGKLADSAAQLRQTGAVLGADARAEQLAQIAEHILAEATRFADDRGRQLSFYAARGARGLETGVAGSLHTEAIELLGLRNVASAEHQRGLAPVSMEQLLLWQPDIIITQEPSTWQHIQTSPQWQGLKAVQQQQVLLLARFPFGWFDSPPGINRLLGIRRLQAYLDPSLQAGFKAEMQQFFAAFYHSELSDAYYQQLMDPQLVDT